MDRYNLAVRVLEWGQKHPREWEIVCGLRNADLKSNLLIAEILRDEKFYELSLMLTIRVTMILQEGLPDLEDLEDEE